MVTLQYLPLFDSIQVYCRYCQNFISSHVYTECNTHPFHCWRIDVHVSKPRGVSYIKAMATNACSEISKKTLLSSRAANNPIQPKQIREPVDAFSRLQRRHKRGGK